MPSKKYFICDLDNCIADDRPRLHLIDWNKKGVARYHEYNLRAVDDVMLHGSEFLLLLEIATPIFLTGRHNSYEAIAREWIASRTGLNDVWLEMRDDDGTTSPADLKRDMWLRLVEGFNLTPDDIVVALDDVPSIVEMYRSFGIPAVRLAIHESDAAYTPEDLKPATTLHHPV